MLPSKLEFLKFLKVSATPKLAPSPLYIYIYIYIWMWNFISAILMHKSAAPLDGAKFEEVESEEASIFPVEPFPIKSYFWQLDAEGGAASAAGPASSSVSSSTRFFGSVTLSLSLIIYLMQFLRLRCAPGDSFIFFQGNPTLLIWFDRNWLVANGSRSIFYLIIIGIN